MAGVYIYDQDCTDFTTLGLCGRLDEMTCDFEEIANGMSEITLEHPLDAMGRHALLIPGRWLKCVVPVRNIPELDEDTAEYVTTAETWKIASGATRAQRTVYNARADQIAARKAAAEARGASTKDIAKIEAKKLAVLKRGRKVTVTVNYGSQHQEWKIKCGKVSGYIDQDALTDRQTYTYTSGSHDTWFDSFTPSWESREQLFRIHDVTRDGDRVIVLASHEFYDAACNLTAYNSTGNPSLNAVLKGIKNNALDECDLNFYSNIQGTRSGAHYRNQNIVQALLDPETGAAARWGADVIRDGHDVYLLADSAPDRGVRLEHGVDLVGIHYKICWDNIVTHIRPIGETASGGPLYLTSNNGFVISTHAEDYPVNRMYALTVPDAVVNTKEGVSTYIARQRMQAAAQEMLASGCDQPDVSLSVNFALLGDTPRYDQYKGLKQLFLFDTVRIVDLRQGIDVSARIVRVVWDCKRERMREVELGTLENINGAVNSWQLTGGISGSKLASGTVSGGALVQDAVGERHIQAESINTDALQARIITSEKIAVNGIEAENIKAGAVTAEKLQAGAIDTLLLTAQEAVIQAIEAGTISTGTLAAKYAEIFEAAATTIHTDFENADDLTAALAAITTLTCGNATFDVATVQHLIGALMTVRQIGTRMCRVENLYLTSANILNAQLDRLTILGADGETYYDVSVGSDGELTVTERDPSTINTDTGITDDGRNVVDGSGMETEIGIDVPDLDGNSFMTMEDGLKWLTVQALNTGKLTATEAFIGSARIPSLQATTLEALGRNLNLIANDTIQLLLGTRNAINTWFSFTESGLVVRKQGSKWSTVTAEDGFHIDHDEVVGHVGSFHRERLEVRGLQIGDITARPSGPDNTGGWVWTD